MVVRLAYLFMVVICVGLCLLVFALNKSTLEREYWRYFGRGFVETDARVVGTTGWIDETSLDGGYSFVVDGIRYDGGGKMKPAKDGFITYAAPKSVKIRHNPKDPSQNYPIYRTLGEVFTPFGVLFVFALFGASTLFLLFKGVIVGNLD